MTSTVKTDQKCWKYIRALNSTDDERLDSIALFDGDQNYSYRRMFRRWELYAEVFSALGVSGSRGARAAMTGTPAAETIIAFYALNMTGTSVSMAHMSDLRDPKRWKQMVEKEGITDLVLADIMLDPDLLERLVRERSALGLRRIIILQIPLPEGYLNDEEEALRKAAQRRLRDFKGVLFMDELLERYAAYDIDFGKKADNAAIIAHTSGTVKGIHKPVPLSDKGLNEAAASMMEEGRFDPLQKRAICALFMDMSSAYAFTDMVHLSLAFGGRIVLAPGIRYIEDMAEVIEESKVNVIFATPAFMDALMKIKHKPVLSALEFVFVGGSYVSAHLKGRYNAFLESCGSKVRITTGYGLSETAGACILSDPGRDDDSMGTALPKVKIKLYDEEEERFYDLTDRPQRGVLFIASPSVSCGRIGRRSFFKLEEIDGGKYLNTYDLVETAGDGYLRYIGRMNKYFVNNEGIRFDAGLIETALSAEPNIEKCCITPGYDKTMHDTIPVLNVSITDKGGDAEAIVEDALISVFIKDGKIKDTNLPGQCRIAKDLPLGDTGKPDTKKIASGALKSKLYRVRPIREGNKLIDIELLPFRDAPGHRAGLPDELDKHN